MNIKMCSRLAKSILAVIVLSLADVQAQASAAPVTSTETVASAETRTQPDKKIEEGPNVVRLRYTKASDIAWWIDPAHNEEPLTAKVSSTNLEVIGDTGDGRAPGSPLYYERRFTLPYGFDRLVASNLQNTIEIKGTPTAVAEVRKIIQSLDQPLRQVEIEAKLVAMRSADIKDLEVPFAASNALMAVGAVPPDFSAKLATLIDQKRAAIINAPRVTAINYLTASLSSFTSTPVAARPHDVHPSIPPAWNGILFERSVLLITSRIGLTVIPIIHDDDTITLVAHIELGTLLPPQDSLKPNGTTPDRSDDIMAFAQVLKLATRLHDQETVVFTGLCAQPIGKDANRGVALSPVSHEEEAGATDRSADSEREVMIVLTARILRRPGE